MGPLDLDTPAPGQCDVTGCERAPEAGALCLFHAEDYEREERARLIEYWGD